MSVASIRLGDCLDVMPTLPDGSVDLILCDLPYGMVQCAWDCAIPFEPLWAQYRRIIRANGAIVLTASQPFTSALVMSNVAAFKHEWIWEKTQATGHFNAKKAPMKAHESVCVFCYGTPAYYPQKTTGHAPVNTYTKRAAVANRTSVYGHNRCDVSGGGGTDRYPRSVIVFPSDKQRTKLDGTSHPTQKPVALMEYLIRTYSAEGETVLDNCMGSGTTGVAAVNTGRRFIGIENDAAYFEIARRRISDVRVALG